VGRRFYYEDSEWPWRPDDFLRRYLKKRKRQPSYAKASEGRALDVGMGYGRNAVWLAEQGYEVEGWELNGAYVGEARREARRRGVKVRCRQVDFAQEPIEGPYDVIVISQVLHQERHSVGLRVLREARRALKPGGQIFLLAKLSRDRYFRRIRKDPAWSRMPGERNTWRRPRPRRREWGRLSWPRGGGRDWVMSALTPSEIRAALRGPRAKERGRLRLRHFREVVLRSDWDEPEPVTHQVAEVVAEK
jgi:SAM-dependent methyltransferase